MLIKKRYLFLCIFLDLCALAVIRLNLYVLNMPEFVCVILSLLIVLSNVLFFIKGQSKVLSKWVVSIFSTLCICFTLFFSYCNPYWNSITYKENVDFSCLTNTLSYAQAKEDLDYAMKHIKKLHPALLHGVPDNMEQQYEQILKELETCEEIDVYTLNRYIESIFSLLGDGHTYAKTYFSEPHYLKYTHEHNENGQRLVEIDGFSIKELLEQNSHLYSYEVESWGLLCLKQDISTLEGLKYLGFTPENGVSYTYEDEEGNRETFTYKDSDFITYEEYLEFNSIKDEEDTEEESFVSYEIDEERSLAVLTLTSCEYNEEYRNCLKEMFLKVKEMGIENVCVDLRDNGGGNSLVADEFIRYLDVDSYDRATMTWRLGTFLIPFPDGKTVNQKYEDLLFQGNVYLLTSESTFSSAMDFAQYIKDNHLGTISGEAPGNTPNGYGEVSKFKLPNSQLYMQISTKEFFRVDKDSTDELVTADVECVSDEAVDVLYESL